MHAVRNRVNITCIVLVACGIELGNACSQKHPVVALVPLGQRPAYFLWLVQSSQCRLLEDNQLIPLLQGFRFPEMLHNIVNGRYATSTFARPQLLRRKRVVCTFLQQLPAPNLVLVENFVPLQLILTNFQLSGMSVLVVVILLLCLLCLHLLFTAWSHKIQACP